MTAKQQYHQKGFDGLSKQEEIEYFFTKGDIIPRYSTTNLDVFLCYRKGFAILQSFRGIYTKSIGWVNVDTNEPEIPEYYLDLSLLKRIESF